MNPGDPRLLQLINDSEQRMLFMGKYWGTYQTWSMCATNGCLTLPRQFATIEAVSVCNKPVKIHDLLFEFLENGFGTGRARCGLNEANYKGNFPVFSDIIPTGKKLQVVCDFTADAGLPFLALGYDDNGNWIRTLQNGVMLDGEIIPMATGNGTLSVNNFSTVTDLQPPVSTGQKWLYEWNVADGTPRMIGQYQNDETRPSYARYYFPWLAAYTSVNCSATPPSPLKQIKVEAVAKMEFIPVVNPNDYLIIGNLQALKEMVMILNNAENEADAMTRAQQISQGVEMAVVPILEMELDHQLGSGRRIGINLQGSGMPDGEPVHNFI